jgi:hypothetical protein
VRIKIIDSNAARKWLRASDLRIVLPPSVTTTLRLISSAVFILEIQQILNPFLAITLLPFMRIAVRFLEAVPEGRVIMLVALLSLVPLALEPGLEPSSP